MTAASGGMRRTPNGRSARPDLPSGSCLRSHDTSLVSPVWPVPHASEVMTLAPCPMADFPSPVSALMTLASCLLVLPPRPAVSFVPDHHDQQLTDPAQVLEPVFCVAASKRKAAFLYQDFDSFTDPRAYS